MARYFLVMSYRGQVEPFSFFLFPAHATCGLGLPRLEGFPSYTETVQSWEQASGYSAKDYNYYLVFAGIRYCIILSRIMFATGQDSEVQNNFASQLLEKKLAELTD